MNKDCQNCGDRLGTMLVKATILGQEKELCLCDVCAQKMGLVPEREDGGAYEQILFSRQTEKVCPNCGMKESAFESSGFAGCSVCYYVFLNSQKLCENWHGKGKHVGKVSNSSVLSKTRLGTLMLRLRNASVAGNFNEVKQIKRELQILEAENAKK